MNISDRKEPTFNYGNEWSYNITNHYLIYDLWLSKLRLYIDGLYYRFRGTPTFDMLSSKQVLILF